MTSELISNQSADDFELPPGCEADDGEERSFAAMLSHAYDATPVPRSLTMRLDAGIAQQWGQSPGLIDSDTGFNVSLARSRQIAARLWWYAGASAAAIVFTVVLMGGSSQYAWASIVAAMREHGMVRISSDQRDRWLDLASGVACEQADQQTQWIDLRRGVALTYMRADQPPHETSLRRSDGALPSDDALLAVFLLGEPISAQSLERFRDVRVIHQQVDEPKDESESTVGVHIALAASEDQRFELSLQLDPSTKLPSSVATSKRATTTQTLTYSRESTDQLRERLLRSEIAIVQSTPSGDISIMTPADKDKTIGDPGPQAESAQSLVATLPVGAPIQWQPVTVVDRSDAEVQQQVDRILSELWQREQIQPVQEAGDLQLLRRAYLDLAGRTPTVTEVRDYSNDTSADRYPKLIERLLSSPDHATQMAAAWRSFLIPEGVELGAFGGREAFEKWLAQRFEKNVPYDRIVRELLLAEGRLSQSGPLLFYSALKLDADQLAARTSRVFLGMRLECAQCHNHPFEPWKQEDFWSYAAFFAQISRPKGMLATASTVMRVQDVDRGEVMLPETQDVVKPRFLGQPVGDSDATDSDKDSSRRQRLAKWLTGANNPYFARATVNRVWSHMFGRGIVDPVDDFGVNNHPVSPELLDTLASQFIVSKFDLKSLIRNIALSHAYRLSSSSDQRAESEGDTERRLKMFAQMNAKTLTAEQLYDCISVATLSNSQEAASSQYVLNRFGNSDRDTFLQQFASPSTSRSEYLAGIPQALMLMNGSMIAKATGEDSSGLIQSLNAPFFTDRQRIDVLFMATLSRPASEDEVKLLEEFLPPGATSEQRRIGLADLLWALVNSSEFTLNH